MPRDFSKSRKPLFISLAILASLLISYFSFPDFRGALNQAWDALTSGDPRQTQQWVNGFGWLGPLMIIFVMVVQMFLIIIPSWLLMIVAIVAYGPFWGSLIVFAGIFVASSVGYLIGRYLGSGTVIRLIGKKAERKVSDFIGHYGIWAIIITRINPFLSNDAISFMAGLVQMRYRAFILSTLAGIAPLIVLMASLGEMTGGMSTGLLWFSVISLAGFIAFIWWDRKKRKK